MSIRLVVRVQPNYKDTYEMKVAPTVSAKLNKITFIKSRELLVYVYMMYERFLKTSGTSKLINEIRYGGLIEAVVGLIAIFVMYKIRGVIIKGFVLNNPNHECRVNTVDIPNPFQPLTAEHRYPSAYDSLFSRKTPRCTKPESTLQVNRPTLMRHQEFTDLTQ
jgi:hypothetical protein